MINVIFKNVGQGDSILFKWYVENEIKIGILDCNLYKNTNPVLDELKKIDNLKTISFLIVSHGHDDHYSGCQELLDYIVASDIKIELFTSTINNSYFQYLQIARSRKTQISLKEFIERINDLEEQKVIEKVYPTYDEITKLNLNEFSLQCLYPRNIEYTKLGIKIDKYINGDRGSKPNLNYISSIFKLFIKDKLYILFTSDCPKHSLNQIQKDDSISNDLMHLGQIPHHGSINNHNKSFWSSRKRVEKCFGVISNGDTNDKLPSTEVIEDFQNLGYRIH